MNIETRLTKLEQYLALSNKKQRPSYVSFTSEEWEMFNSANCSQEERNNILAKHNLSDLHHPTKTYIGTSPDDWDLPNDLKVYVGLDLDRV